MNAKVLCYRLENYIDLWNKLHYLFVQSVSITVFPFLAMSQRDKLQVESLIRVCQEFLSLSLKAVVISKNQCCVFLARIPSEGLHLAKNRYAIG